MPAQLLNPLDRRPGLRGGLPIIAGRFPWVGHLPALAWDLPGFCAWAKQRYGGSAWVDRGFGMHILQLSGDASFRVLRNKETDSSALYDAAATFLGRSMIVIDGPEHRRVRGASSHAFTPGGLDRARVGKIIAEVIGEGVARWPRQPILHVARETRELALAVIFRIIGIAAGDIASWRHQFEELALSALNLPWDLPGSPKRRGDNARRWLDSKVRDIVRRCRAAGDEDSLVGAMVHGVDEHGEALDERELVDNIKLLVLAGHETTASVLAWALLHLAAEPAVWEQLCSEAEAMGGIPESPSDLSRVPLAEGIFREALRLYPPVCNTVRKTNAAMAVDGHEIPIGTIVACNIHELSRDPTRYPRPNDFRPQRWLELGRRPTPLETCQFGGGPHFCLGYHVAMLEGASLLIATARALSAAGVRPLPAGPIPRPRYVPLLHPPRGARLRIG